MNGPGSDKKHIWEFAGCRMERNKTDNTSDLPSSDVKAVVKNLNMKCVCYWTNNFSGGVYKENKKTDA